jgi:hypothetical protein
MQTVVKMTFFLLFWKSTTWRTLPAASALLSSYGLSVTIRRRSLDLFKHLVVFWLLAALVELSFGFGFGVVVILAFELFVGGSIVYETARTVVIEPGRYAVEGRVSYGWLRELIRL